jgi:molybdopterin synthase catalytic subunit
VTAWPGRAFLRLGPYNERVLPPPIDARDWVALTQDVLPTDRAISWATTAGAGAVAVFLGVVRDHAEGRDDVTGMTYEAYEEPAERAMREIAAEARQRWPEIEQIALLHRVGELELSETSVVVVVSAPHRGTAFDAARYCIDTLKQSVPIWKQEHWAGGSDWAVEQHALRPVEPGPGDGVPQDVRART